jgi:hypothetical protein
VSVIDLLKSFVRPTLLDDHRPAHFTALIEGQSVHFVHQKSEEPDAIPVIMLHG